MGHNKDYRKELKEGQQVQFMKDRNCPKCGSRLVALPPDRAWCESTECNYGELHLVGDGVYEQELTII